MTEITEEQIRDFLREMQDPHMDWCKPAGKGLYKTGDVFHGEGMKDQLEETLRKHIMEQFKSNEKT